MRLELQIRLPCGPNTHSCMPHVYYVAVDFTAMKYHGGLVKNEEEDIKLDHVYILLDDQR